MKLLLGLAALLVACQLPIPPPPLPPVSIDCSTSLAHLEEMGCLFAAQYGKACAYHATVGIAYPVVCVADAVSCNEALRCR